MIATTFRSTGGGDLAPQTKEEGRASDMELPIAGTIVGSGSFRCRDCGYMLTLRALDELTDCPECGGSDFTRTKLFETTPANREQDEDHLYDRRCSDCARRIDLCGKGREARATSRSA